MITQNVQDSTTPQMALELLKKGNKRFINSNQNSNNFIAQAKQTSQGQYPVAIILSCIDSRVSPEIIFDQGIGDIFSVRIAGNIVNKDILGSLEFACAVADSKLVVVLGHSGCGAVKSACDKVTMGNMTDLLNKIKPAIQREQITKNERNSTNQNFVDNVSQINVENTVQEIRKQSFILSTLEKKGEIKIVGSMYYLDSGKVIFY